MNFFQSRLLLCLIISLGIILPVCSNADNKPAIDLQNYGVAKWSNADGSHADVWIKVIDHDGVSSDGTSHYVSVKCPDNTVYPITSGYPVNGTSYIYYGSAGAIQNGIYTLIVNDNGNIVEVTDTIDSSYSLDIPDQSTFIPGNATTTSDTTPTFSWAAVAGANHYRVRIYKTDGSNDTVWRGYPGNNTSYTLPPGILLPGTIYKYRISAGDSHSGFDIDHYSNAPTAIHNYITFTTGSQDNSPHIDLDNAGVQTWYDDNGGVHFSFRINVYDAQGSPDDIKEVTVTTPADGTIPLYLNYQKSSNCAVFSVYPHGTLQSGTYTFKAVDKSGNTATRTEELTSNPIGYPPRASITGTLTGTTGTSLEVDWADVPGAAFYRLEIYNSSFSRIYAFTTTISEYTVPEGFLQAGELYRYSIKTRREFFDQNVDNGSTAYGWQSQWPTIVPSPLTGTNTPTIDLNMWGVAVWRSPNPDPATAGISPSIYHLSFDAIVTDDDGLPGNDAKVTVTYPDGTTTIEVPVDHYINSTSAEHFTFVSYQASSASIPNGTYTFKVTDSDGNFAIATDDLVVEPVDLLSNVKPEKNSSVSGTQPKFTWDNIPDASRYQVAIYSNFSRIHRSISITDNFYRVPSNILEKNKLYNYRIYAFKEAFYDVELDNLTTTFLPSSDRPYFWTRPSAMPWMNLLLLE